VRDANVEEAIALLSNAKVGVLAPERDWGHGSTPVAIGVNIETLGAVEVRRRNLDAPGLGSAAARVPVAPPAGHRDSADREQSSPSTPTDDDAAYEQLFSHPVTIRPERRDRLPPVSNTGYAPAPEKWAARQAKKHPSLPELPGPMPFCARKQVTVEAHQRAIARAERAAKRRARPSSVAARAASAARRLARQAARQAQPPTGDGSPPRD
jgi:hypothetical protein